MMLHKKLLALFPSVLLLLSLGACKKDSTAVSSESGSNDAWFFALQFQNLTQEELESELLSHGWVRYTAPRAADGYCYDGTLFGTKSTIFYAVSEDTRKVTALKVNAMQCAPDMASQLEEKLAALGEDEWANVRCIQAREEKNAASSITAWITTVRGALSDVGAVLPEEGTLSLPKDADELASELSSVFDSTDFVNDFASKGESEGNYQLPENHYVLFKFSAMPQEDGTAGTVTYTLAVYDEDYAGEDGQPQFNVY